MKDELNTYGILNSDGVTPPCENEGRVSFDNDKRNFIQECAKPEQDELARVTESFDDPKASSEDYSPLESSGTDISTASSSASSSAASSAASTASAASASIGGGLGALAGVVGTSVVAAVVVVAAFVSSLVINLSLVMADMYSLTFAVTITGADERDFEEPIYAVLTGEDVYREQQVYMDTALLTFDDLESGKEYRLCVKNANKVFADVTAVTASTPNDRCEVFCTMQGKEVTVSVQKAELKKGEYYSLIVKDAQGNVVFVKDAVEAPAEYTFKVDAPKDLYCYLSIKGKTYAISQSLLPSYDFDKGVWTWNDDHTVATAAFPDTRGGEDLVLPATITSKTTPAECEKEGSIVYTAKVSYEGNTYQKKDTVILPAEDHEYEGVEENGHWTFTCIKCNDSYTN